jgi:hypothetical protein
MKNARVKDRLEGLVKSGYVDQEHIAIWGKLRNRSVHAEEQNVRDITTADVQKWYDYLGAGRC